MNNSVAELALRAGVVGAGGAGFPTHVKLNTQVDTVILNGAECEPLMSVDQLLLLSEADRIAAMLEETRVSVGAKEAIIAIKAKHQEAVEEARRAAAPFSSIKIMPLRDFYPAGDEYVLVYETTGRLIPHGGIPLDIGTVVINVETLWNLAEAKEGRPVTHKWVTVTGAVAKPGTFRVPLGYSIDEMLNLAGGATILEFSVINGGPMMGTLVGDLREPVNKTTKGLVVLPKNNPVVQIRSKSLPVILRQAQAICCQCHLCTDLCPRYLLGYQINPHKAILAASFGWKMASSVTEAFLCSECGVCDQFACPMGLSPRRVNQAVKVEMSRQGVKNPYVGKKAVVHPWRAYRRIPSTSMISRLNIKSYTAFAPLRPINIKPDFVVLPLKQHVGVPASPVVSKGDRVKTGQLIADIPGDKLSSRIFASISGYIEECTNERIIIRR